MRRTLELAVAMSLAATGAGGCAAPTEGQADARPMAFTTVVRGIQSGIHGPIQVIIKSEAAWADVWRRHTAFVLPSPPPPQIDFAREMVIGLFIGQRPSGGHEVEVFEVQQEASRLVVRYREKVPPTGMLTTQALTYPHHLIRIGRSDLPVAFEGRQ